MDLADSTGERTDWGLCFPRSQKNETGAPADRSWSAGWETGSTLLLWNPASRDYRNGPGRRQTQRCYTLAQDCRSRLFSYACRAAVRRFFPSMTPRARRALFSVVLFFAVCAVVGSVLQRKVGAQSSADESQLRDSLKSFSNVYALVEQNYAEPIDSDKADLAIYDGAIPGMLRVLDPHSNFYDPKAYAKMREDQHGRYYGVGMLIQQQNNKVYVVTPYENTPSYRAGIRPADIIAAIDGKTTEGMTSDLVAKHLKGPKGTHVQASMVRAGQPKPLVFDMVRDEGPHPSG